VTSRPVPVSVLVLVLALACRPALDDRPWLITKPQIVGVKAEPAEAPPGGAMTLEVVAVDPAGPLDVSATAWTFCRAPKPVGENRVVAPDCLAAAPADAVGSPVAIALPADACRLFGPDTPQPAPGAPPTRPRDPNATGGYYQPIAIALAGSLAVGLQRVTCDLPDASLAVARAFQAAYHPNQNPTISSLAFSVDGLLVDPGAVPAGARVTVEVAWPAGSLETFPVFDRASGAVVDTPERLVASFYVTGGALDAAAVEIQDPESVGAATVWTAPPASGASEMVVILRDSRGGSDAARAVLAVP
jgi:hypothetical protein